MEQEQAEEFAVLRQQAESYLRNSDDRSLRSVIQIFIMPAFDRYIAFDLHRTYKRTSQGKSTVHSLSQTVWYKDVDLEKFRSPVERLKHPRPLMPTIKRKQVPLDRSVTESAIARFTSLQIPVWYQSAPTISLDGVGYEIAFSDHGVSVRYKWSNDPPDAWQPLSEAMHETIRQFELFIQSGETA